MQLRLSSRALSNTLVRDILLILAGSLVVALAAQIAILLPFSLVPISLQTAAVALVGATLGWRRGSLALIAYIGEGLVGLPVFALGRSGIAVAIGPSGGYLVGFIIAAFAAGLLIERGWGRDPLRVLATFAIALALVYVPALPWLANFVGLDNVIAQGLLPFIPGDLVKVVGASVAWLAGERILSLNRRS